MTFRPARICGILICISVNNIAAKRFPHNKRYVLNEPCTEPYTQHKKKNKLQPSADLDPYKESFVLLLHPGTGILEKIGTCRVLVFYKSTLIASKPGSAMSTFRYVPFILAFALQLSRHIVNSNLPRFIHDCTLFESLLTPTPLSNYQ